MGTGSLSWGPTSGKRARRHPPGRPFCGSSKHRRIFTGMGVRFEVDPKRLKSLRTRLELHLHARANKVGVSEADLEKWERERPEFRGRTHQLIAKPDTNNCNALWLDDDGGP